MIRKKRIWLCSLILLLGIFLLFFKRIEEAKFGGFDILELEQIEALVEGKVYTESLENAHELLQVRGQNLAYDQKSNVFYVSQSASERDLLCHIEVTDPGCTVYVERRDGLGNVNDLMQAGDSVRLWAVYEDSYSVFDLVISGAPVMRLDTDGHMQSVYGRGNMVLFEPDEDAVNRQNVKNSCVLVKQNVNSQTYSLKLVKKDYEDEKKLPLLDSGKYSDWKLYAVSENDKSLMRAKLAADMWNIINNQSGTVREYSFVEVVENNSYKGLYLLAPKWSKAVIELAPDDKLIKQEDMGEEQLAAFMEKAGADGMSDYILFLQLVYAYNNIANDCIYVERTVQDGGRQYKIMPDKLEYALGGFSDRLNYLTWGETSRMLLTAEDFGLSEEYWDQEIMPVCSAKWQKLRTQGIDTELVRAFMQEYRSYMIATGLEQRCVEDDSFGYQYDVLEKYVADRICFLDTYYGFADHDQGELTSDEKTEVDNANAGGELADGEGFIEIALVQGGAEDSRQRVKLFVKGSEGYFFLPSYWSRNDLKLTYDQEVFSVKVDGKSVRAEEVVYFATGREYELSVVEKGGAEEIYRLRVMQSRNLPAIFISTYNGTMDYVHGKTGNTEPGSLISINADGSVDCDGNFEKIRMRGNTSTHCWKKTYQLQFEKAQDLLSMGAAAKWVLQANAYDGSYIRNYLAYRLAQELGVPYAVQAEYADVYLNQEYAGSYLICEKVEFGTNRIEVTDDKSKNVQEGGINSIVEENGKRYYEYVGREQDNSKDRAYLIEAQNLIVDSDAYRLDEEDCYFMNGLGRFEVRNPELASGEEVAYISQYVRMVADLIADCDSASKYNQLKQYIDTDSYAAMYLVDMLTNDVDANDYSTFYYKVPDSQGGKLYAGPAWDYDMAFGNDRRNIYVEMNGFPDGPCEALFENEEFQGDVRRKFDQLYIGDLFAVTARRIEQSVQMDEIRWESDDVKTNYSYMSYQDEMEYVKYYYEQRYELLREYLHETDHFCTVTFVDRLNRAKKYYLRRGEELPEEIVDHMNTECGCDTWYREDGKPYGMKRPVFSNMVLYEQQP